MYMFVVRYENQEESLDAAIVFVDCEKVTAKERKQVIDCAATAGILNPSIVSETELLETIGDLDVYELQAYTG